MCEWSAVTNTEDKRMIIQQDDIRMTARVQDDIRMTVTDQDDIEDDCQGSGGH